MIYLAILVLALLVFSGLTSMTEAAIFSAPLSRIYVARDQKRLGARRLLRIKRNIHRPVSALVILNNVINIFGSIYVGGVAGELLESTWKGVFAGLLTFCVIIFAEIIPKTLGERYNLAIGLAAAPLLLVVTRILSPVIWFIEQIARPFAGKTKPYITSEEEIRLLASIGRDAGLISRDESDLITSAFRLNDVTAREIMTHRLDLSSLDASRRLADLKPQDLDLSHSRLLVTEDGDIDRVVGVIYQRDILLAFAEGKTDVTIGDLKNPVPVVYEGTPAHQLLRQFQLTRQHLFVVLDEYGGTSGVVSLEDVLEQLVGEIRDETDPAAGSERRQAQEHEHGFRGLEADFADRDETGGENGGDPSSHSGGGSLAGKVA